VSSAARCFQSDRATLRGPEMSEFLPLEFDMMDLDAFVRSQHPWPWVKMDNQSPQWYAATRVS
jgi:hypothetical protein